MLGQVMPIKVRDWHGGPGSTLCCTRTVFPGSRNVPNVPDVPNVPNVPNNLPNIPGHGGRDGLLAERYVAKIGMLILATYPEAPFETKMKTDIPRFQHVDFWCFGLILTNLGLILD